jgi:hypothetical protein
MEIRDMPIRNRERTISIAALADPCGAPLQYGRAATTT